VFFIKALILFFILFVLVFFSFFPSYMGGYPLGYPDIRQDFRGKGTYASAGGYPLALADSGYPETISRVGLSVNETSI
jgi:hypothetical protein